MSERSQNIVLLVRFQGFYDKLEFPSFTNLSLIVICIVFIGSTLSCIQ